MTPSYCDLDFFLKYEYYTDKRKIEALNWRVWHEVNRYIAEYGKEDGVDLMQIGDST